MKTLFAKLCRAHRIQKGLKQREVASLIGVSAGTYANVESSPYKVIRRKLAVAFGKALELTEAESAELLDAWEQAPLSAFGTAQRERWAVRNKLRSKMNRFDEMQTALVEFLGLVLLLMPDPDTLCNCEFGGGVPGDPNRSCELCSALEVLGLGRWTTKETVLDELSALQDRLETEAKTKAVGK